MKRIAYLEVGFWHCELCNSDYKSRGLFLIHAEDDHKIDLDLVEINKQETELCLNETVEPNLAEEWDTGIH